MYKFSGDHMFPFLLSDPLGMKLLSNSMLNFLRNRQTFPKQLQHVTAHFQCMMVPISPYLHLLSSVSFYYSHPSGWIMVIHCGFDMYFLPWWLMILRIFFMFVFGHNTWIPKKKKKKVISLSWIFLRKQKLWQLPSLGQKSLSVWSRTKVQMTVHTTE